MMNKLIGLAIIALIIYGVVRFNRFYDSLREEQQSPAGQSQQPEATGPSVLPGMPASLESSLDAAKKKGAVGLRKWLEDYRLYVRDPRLADIQLDYVVLERDRDKAKKMFRKIQQRIEPESPVYDRVKALEKVYGQ